MSGNDPLGSLIAHRVTVAARRTGILDAAFAPSHHQIRALVTSHSGEPSSHSPSARVAVLSESAGTWTTIVGCIADDVTTVLRYGTLAELEVAERPDVVITDRDTLTDTDGMILRIRRRWPTTSILVVGANDDADVARLLEIGADDAIVAASPVLRPRLAAAARRARTVNAGARIAIGDVVYDRESHRVWCAGKEIALTRTEESLLDCFFWYSPRAVSVSDLTSFVWGGSVTAERRNLIHVYIGYLRGKLRGSRQVVIRTVRGVGYELAARKPEAEPRE